MIGNEGSCASPQSRIYAMRSKESTPLEELLLRPSFLFLSLGFLVAGKLKKKRDVIRFEDFMSFTTSNGWRMPFFLLLRCGRIKFKGGASQPLPPLAPDLTENSSVQESKLKPAWKSFVPAYHPARSVRESSSQRQSDRQQSSQVSARKLVPVVRC